jgi:hypothetical protein
LTYFLHFLRGQFKCESIQRIRCSRSSLPRKLLLVFQVCNSSLPCNHRRTCGRFTPFYDLSSLKADLSLRSPLPLTTLTSVHDERFPAPQNQPLSRSVPFLSRCVRVARFELEPDLPRRLRVPLRGLRPVHQILVRRVPAVLPDSTWTDARSVCETMHRPILEYLMEFQYIM